MGRWKGKEGETMVGIDREFVLTFDHGPICVEVSMPYTYYPGEINTGVNASIEIHPDEIMRVSEEDMTIPVTLWEEIKKWICSVEFADWIEDRAWSDARANDLPEYSDRYTSPFTLRGCGGYR